MSKAIRIQVKDSKGNPIKQYDITLKPAETIMDLFKEARSVWDEYLIEMHIPGHMYGSFVMASKVTWKQELMEWQYMLDLHDEVAGEE